MSWVSLYLQGTQHIGREPVIWGSKALFVGHCCGYFGCPGIRNSCCLLLEAFASRSRATRKTCPILFFAKNLRPPQYRKLKLQNVLGHTYLDMSQFCESEIPGFSVVFSAGGDDMSVRMVVASTIYHSSHPSLTPIDPQVAQCKTAEYLPTACYQAMN